MNIKHEEVMIRIYEGVDSQVEMEVKFPNDMGEDYEPRPFELAAMYMLNSLQEVVEEFERVKEN
jgi:hypothetical protein